MNECYRQELLRTLKILDLPPIHIDKHSDYYLYFFYHGLADLQPNGILAFITSNAWMNVRYGFPFQNYISHYFRIIQCWDNLLRSFSQADINTVITFIQKPKSFPDHPKEHAITQFIRWNYAFSELLTTHLSETDSLFEVNKNSEKPLQIQETASYRRCDILQEKITQYNYTPHQTDRERSDITSFYQGFPWATYFFVAPLIFF